MTEIDFIVLDLDGGEMLSRCIRSIDAQEGVAVRIIIVDNGSVVPSSQRLPSLKSSVDHILLNDIPMVRGHKIFIDQPLVFPPGN